MVCFLVYRFLGFLFRNSFTTRKLIKLNNPAIIFSRHKNVALINNFFHCRTVTSDFKKWHFLCIQWDGIEGKVAYFYDGYSRGSENENENLKAQLPPGKNFSIDFSNATGKIAQLNIWDYKLGVDNIIAI